MKPSVKGALLSGLVLPGLGQIMFKAYRRGIAIMAVVVAALTAIIAVAVTRALAILKEIGAGGGAIDEGTIADVTNQVLSPADSLMVNGLMLTIAVCWIYATMDAYRLGKRQERERQGHSNVIPTI